MIRRGPANGETNVLGTLVNGLAAVEELAKGPSSISSLSRALGLPRQKTYRLVNTLVRTGWAARGGGVDTYRLTTRVWEIGTRGLQATSVSDLRGQLATEAQELAKVYGESVHLTIMDGVEVVYIDKVDGTAPIRSYTELGGRAPAFCVATGKALLAFSSPEKVDTVIDAGLTAFTDATVATPDALRAELALTRQRGYAVNRGEWRAGVAGVAVPILLMGDEATAALGFSGPIERINANLDELIEALRRSVTSVGGDAVGNDRAARIAART